MKNLESRLQIECVKWFRMQYPKLLLFAIPNGGHRNIVTASILKAEGVVSGVPDLFLAHTTDNYHGLFIEMKHGKNVPTPNQYEAMYKLSLEGYSVEVCNSFESFKHCVENYLKS